MTELQLEICKKVYPDSMIYSVSIDWWEDSFVPISLARVLSTLWHRYFYYDKMIFYREYDEDWEYSNNICLRKLLNEDWSDATLRDQTEETQEKVAESLWVTF